MREIQPYDSAAVAKILGTGLVWAGGLLLLVLLAMCLVGYAGRRLKLPGVLTAAAQLLTPVAFLVGLSLLLDSAGTVVNGRVAWKEERIRHNLGTRSLPGSWFRLLTMTVAIDGGADGPIKVFVLPGEASFDALHEGSPMQVRSLRPVPVFGRIAGESTFTKMPWAWLAKAGSVIGAAWVLWFLTRRLGSVQRGLLYLGAAYCLVIWMVFPTPWDTVEPGPRQTSTAEVLAVKPVDRSFVFDGSGWSEATQPWDVVELRFVPHGRDQPVIAVDSVDRGSVPGLTPGSRLAVTYTSERPRDARIESATRGYRSQEWRDLVADHGAILLVVFGFGALLGLARRFRR